MTGLDYSKHFEERAETGRKNTANGDGRSIIGIQVGRLRVLSVDDLLALPRRDYLLKGVFSPGEISLLVGGKNSRKTFLGIYLDYLLALGHRVIFGRRAKQTSTLYVICEGDKGVAKRVEAQMRQHGKCSAFHVIAQQVDLLHTSATEGDLHDIIEAARLFGVGKITIDTVSRVMLGGKENSPEDMGVLLGNMGALRDATGAHIMGVHHGTKEDSTNSRGHSILPNGADVILQVEWTGEATGIGTVTIGFARDDVSGVLGSFRTEIVDLGKDADGDPITTLRIEEIDAPDARTKTSSPRLSDKQKIALDALRRAIAAHGEPAPASNNIPSSVIVVSVDLWRRYYLIATSKLDDQNGNTRRRAWRLARDALQAKHMVCLHDEVVWIA